MVSLSMMASIVEAVRPEAPARADRRSGPADVDRGGRRPRRHRRPDGRRAADAAPTRQGPARGDHGHQGRGESSRRRTPASATASSCSKRVHRFGEAIGALADAIRVGDADAAVDLLSDPPEEISWIGVDAGSESEQPALAPVRSGVVDTAASSDRGGGPGRGARRRSRRSAGSGSSAPIAAGTTASRAGRPGSRAGSATRSRRSRTRAAGTSAARCWSRRTTTACASTTATSASSSGAGSRSPPRSSAAARCSRSHPRGWRRCRRPTR